LKTRHSIDQLNLLVKKLVEFTGWRTAALVALMVAAALSEGLGLVLIIPLLAFTGSMSDVGSDSLLTGKLEKFVGRFEFVLSFEFVLTVFVMLVVVRQLVVFFGVRLAADTRIDYVASVRKEFFAALGETSWRFLSGRRQDQLGQILLADSWRIGEAALHLVRILSGLVMLLANIVVALLVSPILSSAVLVSILIITLLFSNRLHKVQQQGRDVGEIQNNVYRVVENYLENIRTAKMAGATHQMRADFGQEIDNLSNRLSAFISDSELVTMSLQIAGAIAIAVALLVAVSVLQVSGPELLLLIFITARFIPRVSALNHDLHLLIHNLPAFEHAYELLSECRRNPDVAANRRPIAEPRETIAVSHVFVTFEEDPDNVILDDVSLSLSVGEMVALTGKSGVGKTTLVDVVAGLLLPNRGEILIDGLPLEASELGGWRDQVGYVSQSAALLQATVEQNLNWVINKPADGSEIRKALQCAEISDVITGLPQGLDTVIDRRDGRLSSGERQRLAIARELLRNPRILILDEATNALDVDTEFRVLKNLRHSYPELTILMVAHRHNAIALADREVCLGRENDAQED